MAISQGGRKRRYRRKPRGLISSVLNKKYSVKDIATTAWKGVKYIKQLINAEAKHVDVSSSAQAVSNAGAITHLSPIAQGDGASDREGLSVYTKGLFIRYGAYGNSTNEHNHLRIIVFRDTMNTGTAPGVSDVIEHTGDALAPFSPLKSTAFGRYNILYSKLLTLGKYDMFSQVGKAYIPIKKHIKYTGTLSTDEWKNQLYILLISDVSENDPSISWYSRLTYYDN